MYWFSYWLLISSPVSAKLGPSTPSAPPQFGLLKFFHITLCFFLFLSKISSWVRHLPPTLFQAWKEEYYRLWHDEVGDRGGGSPCMVSTNSRPLWGAFFLWEHISCGEWDIRCCGNGCLQSCSRKSVRFTTICVQLRYLFSYYFIFQLKYSIFNIKNIRAESEEVPKVKWSVNWIMIWERSPGS